MPITISKAAIEARIRAIKPKPISFGIDPSTKCGWAMAMMVDGKPSITAKGVVCDGKIIGMARAMFIAGQIREYALAVKPLTVVMEGYSFGSPNGLVYVVEIATLIRFQLLTNGFKPLICPPSALKKFVTGKGTSKKEEMLMHAYKRWGIEFKDNNECDAGCLAILGLVANGQYSPPVATMKDALTKITVCS